MLKTRKDGTFKRHVSYGPIMKKYTDYKKIALYGTGLYAKKFILDYYDLPIYCILDRNTTEGIFEGYPIISVEEAINANIDVIIVLSSIKNEKIIYDRIADICKKNSIAMMDRFGNNLIDTFESNFWGYSTKEKISLDVLENEISTHDVITFDIFDTLLMRMTLTPEDVFDIVEHRLKGKKMCISDFKVKRIFAERNAIKTSHHTLDGIYDELKQLLDLSDEECDIIKNEEINVERDVIIARKRIVEIYNKAKQLNKKIYLVSDMYLPESILATLLKDNGIEGYDGLLISGFEGLSKYNGLFNLMKNKVQGDSYLHIGDNKDVDGLAARVYGLDAFVIPSSVHMLYKYAPYMALAALSINERSLLGLYTAIRFNDPFVDYVDGKTTKISLCDYCRCFIAPLVTVFLIWLMGHMEKSSYKNILFASRDGYVFYKLYKKYSLKKYFKNVPQGIYFYTSRKAAMNSSLRNAGDIDYIRAAYGHKVLKNIFDGDISDNFKMIELSNMYRENYIKYLKKNDINISETAFVDLVSSGTTQYFLQNGMHEEIRGYYLARILGFIQENMNIIAMSLKTNTDIYLFNPSEVFILENVLTSPEASLICFNNNGEPVFDSNVKNMKQLNWLQECFEGIEDFYAKFISKLYIPSISLNPAMGEMLFFSHHDVDEEKENELFSVVSFVDNLNNKAMKKNG